MMKMTNNTIMKKTVKKAIMKLHTLMMVIEFKVVIPQSKKVITVVTTVKMTMMYKFREALNPSIVTQTLRAQRKYLAWGVPI